MMTFKDFKKRMEILKTYCDYENKLDDLGICLWERDEISNLFTEYVNMIAEAFNLPKNPYYGTDLDYFMYEVHWGKDIEDKNSEFASLENLYAYFCNFPQVKENI